MHPSNYGLLHRNRDDKDSHSINDVRPETSSAANKRRSLSVNDNCNTDIKAELLVASHQEYVNNVVFERNPNDALEDPCSPFLGNDLNSDERSSQYFLPPPNNQSEREKRPRSGSGSWHGANESDDEVDHITQILSSHQTNSRPNDPSCSMISSTTSYQNSYPSISTVNSQSESLTVDRMRKRLKFYFMNPMEKWKAKSRFPWKLLVQVIKIVIVTSQLCMFASQRYNHVTYLSDTKTTFSHLFLKGWESSREINVYPPSDGPLALYKITHFYEFLDYAIITFCGCESLAIGSYKFVRQVNKSVEMPTLCFTQYKHGFSNLNNLSFTLDNEIKSNCIHLPEELLNNMTNWSVEKYLKAENLTINFDLLLEAQFTFHLNTVKLRINLPFDIPECYKLTGKVLFNNMDHDGQMLVDLDVAAVVLQCKGNITIDSSATSVNMIRIMTNIMTLTVCSLSFVMCVRAIYRAQCLRKDTDKFYCLHFQRNISFWEKYEFVNLWYVLICVNDCLIITGTIIKIELESQKEKYNSVQLTDPYMTTSFDYEGYLDKWNVCSLFLGLGNLLMWFGCLRYLGFFSTYNVLILTIKGCFPNVLRYSICIAMVFAGYAFCGWLVLGPYHLKFRSLSSTIECLYSLINGDDMFATFSSTSGKDTLIWWFSRIYLYTFISLFIYVILSLFIAIIMDAYDTIKRYNNEGFPLTHVRQFAKECELSPESGAFHDESDITIHDICNYLCCCSPTNAGYEAIATPDS